jgi:hypothetical protein
VILHVDISEGHLLDMVINSAEDPLTVVLCCKQCQVLNCHFSRLGTVRHERKVLRKLQV